MYIKTFKKKSPTVIFENSYFVEATQVSVEMVYLPWQQTLTMVLSHVSVTLMDRWVLIVVSMEDNVNVDRMSLVVNVPDVRRDTMVSQDVQVCHYSHSGMGFDGFVWTPPWQPRTIKSLDFGWIMTIKIWISVELGLLKSWFWPLAARPSRIT
jgi:hypothetical protein